MQSKCLTGDKFHSLSHFHLLRKEDSLSLCVPTLRGTVYSFHFLILPLLGEGWVEVDWGETTLFIFLLLTRKVTKVLFLTGSKFVGISTNLIGNSTGRKKFLLARGYPYDLKLSNYNNCFEDSKSAICNW